MEYLFILVIERERNIASTSNLVNVTMYFIISSVGGGQQKNVVSIGRGCCCDEGLK